MNRTETVKRKYETVDLAYMALGAVLIALCSWISIPAVVPFTMQTFAVFLVLLVLGGRRGTMTIVVYVLLGAVGLPVFSQFGAGIGVLLGSTGGYILGFIFMGLTYRLVTGAAGRGRFGKARWAGAAGRSSTSKARWTGAAGRSRSGKVRWTGAAGRSRTSKVRWAEAAALVLGLLVLYAFGTAWYMFMYARTQGGAGLMSVLLLCVIPFVIPDLIKLALALALARRLAPAFSRM